MADNRLSIDGIAPQELIRAMHILQILTALKGGLFPRGADGNPAAGQDLGSSAFPWGTIHAAKLIVGGRDGGGNVEASVLSILLGLGINLNLDPDGESAIQRNFQNPSSRPDGFISEGTLPQIIPGADFTAGNYSLLQISGYDDLLVRNDEVRAVNATVAGNLFRENTATNTYYVQFSLFINGVDSGQWVRLGRDGGYQVLASLSATGQRTVLNNRVAGIRVSGSGAGTNAMIMSLEAFEALFRTDTTLVDNVTVDTQLNLQPYAIPGNPRVPPVAPGRRLRVTVKDFTGSADIALSDLLAKDSIEVQGTIAPADDPANAIKFSLEPTNNPGSTQDFYLCHNDAGDILFGVRAAGSKTITIIDHHYDASQFVSNFRPIDNLPSITGFAVGNIVNFKGVLYSLNAGATNSNVISGIVQNIVYPAPQPALRYRGTAEVQFRIAGAGAVWRLILPTTLFNDEEAARTTVYAQYIDARGQTVDIVAVRANADNDPKDADDFSTAYVFVSGADESIADSPNGTHFRLSLFTDSDHSAALDFHGAVNHWQPLTSSISAVEDFARKDMPNAKLPVAKLPGSTGSNQEIYKLNIPTMLAQTYRFPTPNTAQSQNIFVNIPMIEGDSVPGVFDIIQHNEADPGDTPSYIGRIVFRKRCTFAFILYRFIRILSTSFGDASRSATLDFFITWFDFSRNRQIDIAVSNWIQDRITSANTIESIISKPIPQIQVDAGDFIQMYVSIHSESGGTSGTGGRANQTVRFEIPARLSFGPEEAAWLLINDAIARVAPEEFTAAKAQTAVAAAAAVAQESDILDSNLLPLIQGNALRKATIDLWKRIFGANSHQVPGDIPRAGFLDYMLIGLLSQINGHAATDVFTDPNSSITLIGGDSTPPSNTDFQHLAVGDNRPNNWGGFIASSEVTEIEDSSSNKVGTGIVIPTATTKKLQVLIGTEEIPAVLVYLVNRRVRLYLDYNAVGDLELYKDGAIVQRTADRVSDPELTIKVGANKTGDALRTTYIEWNPSPNGTGAMFNLDQDSPVTGLRMASSNDSVVIQLTRILARGQRFTAADFQAAGVSGWTGFIPFYGTNSIGFSASNNSSSFTTGIRILVKVGEDEVRGALVRESATVLALICDRDLGMLTLYQGTGGDAAAVGSAIASNTSVDYYIDGAVDNTTHRYIWNVPAISANTNYAIVPSAPNADMVELSKVEILPDDRVIKDDDVVEFKKFRSHNTVGVEWEKVKEQIGTGGAGGGGGSTGPSPVTETAVDILSPSTAAARNTNNNTNTTISMNAGVNVKDYKRVVFYFVPQANRANASSPIYPVSVDSRDFTVFGSRQRQVQRQIAPYGSSVHLLVNADNNSVFIRVTPFGGSTTTWFLWKVVGINENAVGGAGVTSYAALPSEVINGNIISIVGDGWYKGIGGIWVRSKEIEKVTQIYEAPGAQGLSIPTNPAIGVTTLNHEPYTHFRLYGSPSAANKTRQRSNTLIDRRSTGGFGGAIFWDVAAQNWSMQRTDTTNINLRDRGSNRFRYLYYIDGINISQGWDE